jgi:hypothetical protein
MEKKMLGSSEIGGLIPIGGSVGTTSKEEFGFNEWMCKGVEWLVLVARLDIRIH